MKQEGLFKNAAANNAYERYNFRTNMDINLAKGLYFNILTSAAIGKHKFPYTGTDETTNNAVNSVNSIFNSLLTIPANAFPLFNKNGTLGGTSEYQSNPYGMLNKRGYRTDESRLFNAQVKAKYELDMIVEGLSVDLAYGFENFNKQYLANFHKYAVFQEMPDGTYTQFGTDDSKDTRNSGIVSGFYRYNMFSAGVNYNHSFGESDLLTRLVYNQSSETATGDNPDYKYQGLSLRATYGYKNRYYAEFTGAYQGSNNFKKGKRNGFFPALGLGWILTEENWLKNVDKIDFLKLRASYGLVGNDQTGGNRFPYRQTYTMGNGYVFGVPGGSTWGTEKGVLPNENEKWENSYKANIGIDMNFLNGFSLSADYFKERRTDVLVDYANVIPNIIGIELSKYNAGKIDNQGIEASLRYNKKINDWEFFAGGNMLWAKNKIVDLKEIAYQYPHQFRKGHSIQTVFGYQTNGLYLTQDQLNNAPIAQFGIPALGDLIYVNQNVGDDNIIDSRDQVALGNTFPELIYGVSLGAKYKGFDFYCNMEGSGMYYTNFIPAKLGTYAYENRWDPANPAVGTKYPRLSIANNYNQQTSDFWQEKTNLFRISAMEFGYTLPSLITQKVFLSSVRFYLNINNLHTFSNVKDKRNPEAVNAGYSEVPLLRTYSFGVSINL
jgi:TonB-linked SusC/RagA family outer membrane protein